MTGRLAEAVARYRQALALAPSDWKTWHNLALAYEKQGDGPAACEALTRLLVLNPDFAPARQMLERLSKPVPGGL